MKIVLAKVVIASLLFAASGNDAPADTNETDLASATVLLALETRGILKLTLGATDSENEFELLHRSRNRVEVAAGTYYVKEMTYFYDNMLPLKFDLPSTNSGIISVSPGTVTYLGDWKLDFEYQGVGSEGRTIKYDFGTLQKYLKKDPSLTHRPLRISTDSNGFMDLDWKDVIDYKKP